ncbi:hypothetical protein A0O21_08900 [Streptococcus pantholopis]|uniref:Lipoprotein n=2 Tax=Streptococcus pantholopis TaxID=1811193 RepID=A0A172QAE9_9STRE|nr:hypothetical protein A0O21_08900 [Streptococcus pantholopis]
MNRKKALICIISLLMSFLSTGCVEGINDTANEIKKDINQEMPTDDIEGLKISEIFKLKPEEEVDLSSDFSGYIYIMASKEDIKDIEDSSFSLSDNNFHDIEKNTFHDFNIRYQSKTYFTVKQIRVESINSVKISSNFSKNILLVLRENED